MVKFLAPADRVVLGPEAVGVKVVDAVGVKVGETVGVNLTQSEKDILLLQGNLWGYKGAIFENLVADFFGKMGRKLYYYHKDSGLEIDFVIRWRGECVLVEAKAGNGNIKSTKTVLKHPEKYHVYKAIKLGDYNVGAEGRVITLPMYMGFLLTEYRVDMSTFNDRHTYFIICNNIHIKRKNAENEQNVS